MSIPSYRDHLCGWEGLVTPYEATRAGFVELALEKNRRATPVIAEARALRVITSKCKSPQELLNIPNIRTSLLTAAGVSEKASKHLTSHDKDSAIKGLIDKFLDPSGEYFAEELVYRFLLTRGDSLGGSMRNIGGVLSERKLSRTILSTLRIKERNYMWLHSKSRAWVKQSKDDSDIELNLRGIYWELYGKPRTLIYNLKVPIVKKNVDLCLFDCRADNFRGTKRSCHEDPSKYIALGELKGGIDPAGADEHWKTANSALNRVRNAFRGAKSNPYTFFIGAAIESSMAKEIFDQLETDILSNAANLTNENQIISFCDWLIHL